MNIIHVLDKLILTHILCAMCRATSVYEDIGEIKNQQLLGPIEKLFMQNELNRCSCLISHSLPTNSLPSIHLKSLVSISAAKCQSAGVFSIQIRKNDFTSISSFKKLADVGKFRPTCTLGLIYFLDKSSVETLPKWFDFLQQLHGIIKTDQDQFVFGSNTESSADFILSSHLFGERFKFAVALSLNTQTGNNISIRYLCHWCNEHSTKIRETSAFDSFLFSDKTRNFHRKLLKVSTPTSTRWLNEMHTVGKNWIPKRGIYSIVLDQLMIKYNFTVEFIPSTGGGTGAKVNKTIWVGTVGDVLYRKADIGHVTATTLQRSIVVDSTFPISYEWLTFTTGIAPEHHSWKTIYWPFTPFVWQLTALGSFLCVVLFKVVLKATRQRTPVGKIVEYMLAVVMEEGVKDPEQYPTHSLRFTMVIWLIFGLLMGTAYRSKLTAFLAFPHMEHLPQSFEELAVSKYSIGLQYIKGAAYQILKSSKNPTYVTIFKRMELEESDVRCFKRTISDKFACISWDSIADYVYHKNLTDKYGHAPVVKSPASTCFLTAGLVVEKRSILKKHFDHFLIWAMDTGMISKWKQIDHDYVDAQRKHWEKETDQPEIDYTPPQNIALTISHLTGSNYLFAVGLFASFVSFIAEKMYSQYRKCMGLENIQVKISSSSSKKQLAQSNDVPRQDCRIKVVPKVYSLPDMFKIL